MIVVASNYGWSFLESGVEVPKETVNPLMHTAAQDSVDPSAVQALIRMDRPTDLVLGWSELFPRLVVTGLVVTDPTTTAAALSEKAKGAPVRIVTTSRPTAAEWTIRLPHRYCTLDPDTAEQILAYNGKAALEFASHTVTGLIEELPVPLSQHSVSAAALRTRILASRPHIPTDLTTALAELTDRLDEQAHRSRHDITAASNHFIHARANEAFTWLYTRDIDGTLAADIAYTHAITTAMHHADTPPPAPAPADTLSNTHPHD